MLSRLVIASSCIGIGVPVVTRRIVYNTIRNQMSLLRRGLRYKSGKDEAYIPRKQSFWKQIFGKYLLTTNTISSGVLMVLGDIVAQEVEMRRQLEKKEKNIDYNRVWRMFIVGALMGPLHHYVYLWMDRFWPVASVRNSFKKILIDQLVMSPVCILLFFYSACFLERKSVDETNKELISKFPYIYLMDWLFWPGAQYVNFQYLHTKYRVTFVNVCTCLYNVFLSYMKHDFNLDFI